MLHPTEGPFNPPRGPPGAPRSPRDNPRMRKNLHDPDPFVIFPLVLAECRGGERKEHSGRRPPAASRPAQSNPGVAPSPGTPPSTRNRMNSVLIVSTIVASVGLSIAITALLLRIALKLLGRNLAK